MPELPDIELYRHALGSRLTGQPLERVRLASPFLVRSVDPKPEAAVGLRVVAIDRIGKRIVWRFEEGLAFVFHLMIAGRFQWRARGARLPGRMGLAGFDFPDGTLLMTEAGSKRRASLHVVRGDEALREHDPGGLDVLACDPATFDARLRSENHTLKRALTDPRLFSGIGNARHPHVLARPADRGGRRDVPGKGHGISRRHGRARSIRSAVPAMRDAGAAHSVRNERGELLSGVSDGRQAPCGSSVVAAAEVGLAAHT